MAEHKKFTDALKTARLAEAAHLDALMNVKDARSLRLAALRGLLLPQLAGHHLAQGFTELAIMPGETPRLWIDLISSVVIEPDTRNFRLEQESEGRRDILHETPNLDEMSTVVLKYIAHRVVARERTWARGKLQTVDSPPGYSLGALAYVWFTGVMLGVLALLILAILLGFLRY